jgi:PHP domain
MPEITGVLHVHSNLSRDGEMDLEALVRMLRADGHRFACITEHAQDLDPDLTAAFIARCRALSDDTFCLIPGLEFDCGEGLHILGVGLSRHAAERSARAVVAAIHAQGGLAILAHALPGSDAAFAGGLDLPDGIEIWNTKYDSRYAPRRHRFAMLARLRTLKTEARGYCGIDFHWSGQFRGACLVIGIDRIAPEPILGALREGRFVCSIGRTTLDPRGVLTRGTTIRLRLREACACLLMGAVRSAKRVARRAGARLPKRRLRSILLRVT